MRLSVSLLSRYGYGDARRGAQAMVERAVAAREAGLDALYLGDHHSVATGYYQNTPMLGRLLAEWPRVAGSLHLLPLWHPVLLAEQVATLAAIARGRFVLQVALGGGAGQFGAMGVALPDRVRRFEPGLDVVRRLLAGDEVSTGAPHFIRGAHISPLPPEPIAVWLAGHASPAQDRAARMADGWVGGPQVSIEHALELADGYRAACARHGREPGAVVVRRDVHVAAGREEADRILEWAAASGYRGFDPGVLVVGTVDEVTDRLRTLALAGFDEVAVRQIAPDHGDALASIARLADVRQALLKS